MTTSFTRESWAQDLLTRMGYPVTDNNMTSVLAWEHQEGGHFANAATYNPLNTTLGHATYGSMNSVGVSTYPDYETGMSETIKTLNSHHYDKIRSDLQAGADPSTTTADIKASPWGTWHGGASTSGALKQARADLAAHPIGTTPAPAHPATTSAPHPATTSAPHPATSAVPATPAPATPAALAAATPASAGSGSFVGADVDGLDRLSQEFTQAAQICDEVRMVCEAIVAAASMFGPFGAAFVAYLKGTVIPWLQKISQALQAMAKVLALHSQAQKDASSSATSLPGYQTPSNLPTTSTQNYPTIVQAIETAALTAVLGPAASATAAVALIGAVAASTTGTTSTTGSTATTGSKGTGNEATSGEKPETPEQVAPHTAEASRAAGAVMGRDTVQEFEDDELGVKGAGSIHPTATIAQANGDVAVYSDRGQYVDTNILQLKGGAAAFGGYDATNGYQLGVAGTASANLVDVKVHDDVSLGPAGTLKLADDTMVGGTAQAQAIAAYNPATQTVTVGAGGDAFAGVRTTATIAEVTPYFTNTTELTGQLGAGAAADGGIVLSPGHIDIHGSVGAAVGLGGKVSDHLDINYQKIATDTYTGATTLVNEAGAEITSVGRTIGGYLAPAPGR